MQFGGQFGAGRAGADDRDVELAGAHRSVLRLRAQAGIDQAPVEALGLRRRLQRHRIFGNARRAEIVGDAADRDHQRVVTDRARRRDLAPLVVEGGGEMHLLSGAIEPDHLAEAIAEPVPMRLGEVVHFVFAGIEAPAATSCNSGFQRWVRAHSTRVTDARAAPAQAIAEPGDELQPRRAAAHHDDAVQRLSPTALAPACATHLRLRISMPVAT